MYILFNECCDKVIRKTPLFILGVINFCIGIYNTGNLNLFSEKSLRQITEFRIRDIICCVNTFPLNKFFDGFQLYSHTKYLQRIYSLIKQRLVVRNIPTHNKHFINFFCFSFNVFRKLTYHIRFLPKDFSWTS